MANPAYTVPTEMQDQIQAYLQSFWTGEGFLADTKEDTPNPIATYFGFAIRKRVGLLQPAELSWFFRYFIGAFEQAIKTIDYAIPETVANMLYCKKFFNTFEMEPDFQPFGFPLSGDCIFLQPFVKQLLECPNPAGEDVIHFSKPEKLQQEFQVNRQVVAQEVAQLLREPRLTFKKPEPLPIPPVAVNPFAFLNPVEEAKRDGKISQNSDWGELLEEMDSSVGDLGKVLSTVKMLGGGRNSPGRIEKENQETPEIHGKNDTGGKKTQIALMEEEFDLNARREKLTEWLVRALPKATRYQLESYVAEILKMEKTHQLDTYLEFIRREKGVDTRDFPAAK